MRVLITHPTGNEFFRAAMEGFYEAGILQSVYTSIASFPGTWPYKSGSFKLLADIKRRALDGKFKNFTHTHPWRESGRLLAIKMDRKKLIHHETGVFSVDAVYKSLDKNVEKNLVKEKQRGVSAVYAYEDGGLYTFRKAKALNIKCLYDLPIGYWRSMHNLLEKEKALNPEWSVTMDGLKDSPEKLNRKDEELKLADSIFVASSFTAATLKKYPGILPAVKIIPYGFPPVAGKTYQTPAIAKKLKLLFVGGLSQRKGLSYLFNAVKDLENYVSLTVVGRLPVNQCKVLNMALKKHTHIASLPHEKILELMRAQDVLILPSLFEGFGQVITEAMAQGTPVITTERTAGADIIKHGENGWLVKAGSAEEIEQVIEHILTRREMIAEVGEQALETAKKRPWAVYGRELAEAVMTIEN